MGLGGLVLISCKFDLLHIRIFMFQLLASTIDPKPLEQTHPDSRSSVGGKISVEASSARCH